MSIEKDIPIKFTNKTGKTDFNVLVYTANQYVQGDSSISVAYEVLRTQTTVTFVHPRNFAVSATYHKGGQEITAGPIPAIPGNKYEIVKETELDAAIIREGIHITSISITFLLFLFILIVRGHYKRNRFGAITIINRNPKEWDGRLYNCELRKGSRIILLQPDVRTNNEAVFLLQPALKFAISRNLNIQKTFMAFEISGDEFIVNLENYPNGVEVTLTELPGGLYYNFTARSLLYT